VDQDAVNEHLAHGDFLGKCTPDCKPPSSFSSSIPGSDKLATPDVISGALNVKVLPNPATTEFNLMVNNNSKEKIEIMVFDMYGKKVYQARGAGNERYRFGKEFAAGTYILWVNQSAKSQRVKLVKGE
jgi:hypothetical protein